MDEDEESMAFFLMPDKSLRGLKEELAIVMGDKSAGELVHRLGYRSGEEAGKDSLGKTKTFNTFSELKSELPEYWMHLGLSSIEVLDGNLGDFRVALSDTVEAKVSVMAYDHHCHFTRGFLEGMVTMLFNKKYIAIEKSCLSYGDAHCIFHLKIDENPLLSHKERQVTTKKKYHLKNGVSYMLGTDGLDIALKVFIDQVTHGHEGLIITRTYPKSLKDEYGLKNTGVLWLSKENDPSAQSVNPSQLGLLHHRITDFLQKSAKGVVLLDGLEYLATQNSFSSVLKVTQLIRDKVARYQTNFLVSLNPDAFTKKDFSLIAKELLLFRSEEQFIPLETEEVSEQKESGKYSKFSHLVRK